jgi:DNA repair exonuclease SbcCD ATPase subunit
MRTTILSTDIEGFRSVVKPLHFDFDRPGTTLIRGRNGAGKTTIFESVPFALYGINLKGTTITRIPSWPEVRPTNWMGTRVWIEFMVDDVKYYVIRHLGYKGDTLGLKGEDSLMLLKVVKGVPIMVGDCKNKELTQEAIDKLVGVDANTFVNSILFGQRMAKLVEQDNSDKRELFETLFDMAWVAGAKVKCEQKLREAEADWNSTLVAIGNKKLLIETKQDNYDSVKTMLDGWEDERAARLSLRKRILEGYCADEVSISDRKERLLEAQEKLGYDATKHVELDAKYNALHDQVQAAELAANKKSSAIALAKSRIEECKRDMDRAHAALRKLNDKKVSEDQLCPYCEQELRPGNKLEANHRKEVADATIEIERTQNALDKAAECLKIAQAIEVVTVDEVEKEMGLIEVEVTPLDALLIKYNEIQKHIEHSISQKTQIDKDIERTRSEIKIIEAEKPPDVDLKLIQGAINFEKTKLAELENKLPKLQEQVELAKWWNTKGLGAGGVKAFIFKAMLSQLNENVKKYGNRLGASLEFSIDLTKASKPFTTICSLGDKLNKEYKEFSGGQKQRLDIVLIFGMYDLISMNTDFNLLIMDEPFDGLDEEGEAVVFDLIRNKADEGKSVYIIAHSHTVDSLYCSKIEFDLINGNTQMI